MSRSLQLFSALSSFNGPALTWYASHSDSSREAKRQELGAAVVSRWLAKIANLLGTDLADLFGNPNQPRSIMLDLPNTWQEALWAISASLMGWDIHYAKNSAHICDVLVSNALSAHSSMLIDSHLEQGADVLLHNTAPLALAWNDDLPANAMDALAAIMSQPDSLIVDLAYHASTILSAAPTFEAVKQASSGDRVFVDLSCAPSPLTLIELWERGASGVVVTYPVDAAEAKHLRELENCSL